VKCRPPNNRDPLGPEIEACHKWLDQQLSAISPRLVVTLGRHSMNRYFPGESISKIHGQARKANGITVVPMFHPAAALHQQRYRSLIEDDFRALPAIVKQTEAVNQIETVKQVENEASPRESDAKRQMRLF
jgi:uracil-DNA glycosylase family 4